MSEPTTGTPTAQRPSGESCNLTSAKLKRPKYAMLVASLISWSNPMPANTPAVATITAMPAITRTRGLVVKSPR